MTKQKKLPHCEATWTTAIPHRHSFAIFAKFKLWPLLATDQWFLPRLKVLVQNQGETIPRAQVSIEIAEYNDVATFSNYSGPVKDVKHFEINDFIAGDTQKLSFTIPSKFLKPASYMLRIRITKFEPAPSPFEQLKETVFGNSEMSIEKMHLFNKAIETMQAQSPGLDLHVAQVGVYRGIQLCDWRLHEVLKVHSAAGPAGITAAIALPAALIAVGKLLFEVGKLIVESMP